MIAKRLQVTLQRMNGASGETLSELVNQGDGSYQASYTGTTAGTVARFQGLVTGERP